jgi:hypothetical protein
MVKDKPGDFAMIKTNQPFDAHHPDFTIALRQTESLSAEVKFYANLGRFVLAHSYLLTHKGPIETINLGGLSALSIALGDDGSKKRNAADALVIGCFLAHKAGIKQPPKDYPFFDTIASLDMEKIKWGAKLFKAVASNDVTKQIWEADHYCLLMESSADAEFKGAHDHRLAHGVNPDPECKDEEWDARVHAPIAAFELEVFRAAVQEMQSLYWSRERAAPNFLRAFSDHVEHIRRERRENFERIKGQTVALREELYKDNLARVVHLVYNEESVPPQSIWF